MIRCVTCESEATRTSSTFPFNPICDWCYVHIPIDLMAVVIGNQHSVCFKFPCNDVPRRAVGTEYTQKNWREFPTLAARIRLLEEVFSHEEEGLFHTYNTVLEMTATVWEVKMDIVKELNIFSSPIFATAKKAMAFIERTREKRKKESP